uniref:ORF3 n=1 Tax=Porcine epidemic diarrhea virus TaxID=28295 RepID=A0A249JPV2_PEDV|nr:ORF3 [Porcine epidemic diarrhea virus]
MFLGLFQYTIDTVVKDVSKSANLSLDAVQELELNVVPIRQASNVTGFLFTSVFIYFFALFKASSLRRNYIMLAARFAVIVLYCPLLYYCGAFLDATIICCTLIGRLCLVCFYSWRYKNALFIIFNTTTLSFLNGKADYYDGKSIVILEGGDHYITFGNSFVAFVSSIYVGGKKPTYSCCELLSFLMARSFMSFRNIKLLALLMLHLTQFN